MTYLDDVEDKLPKVGDVVRYESNNHRGTIECPVDRLEHMGGYTNYWLDFGVLPTFNINWTTLNANIGRWDKIEKETKTVTNNVWEIPAEPGESIKRIHPIGCPEDVYVRNPNGDSLWMPESDLADDPNPRSYEGQEWQELLSDWWDNGGFEEAEDTPAMSAVKYFTKNSLTDRPTKLALEHARVLIEDAKKKL